jgi:hypothetical protein
LLKTDVKVTKKLPVTVTSYNNSVCTFFFLSGNAEKVQQIRVLSEHGHLVIVDGGQLMNTSPLKINELIM